MVHADNTTALAYIRKQGRTHSFSLCQAARDLLLWADQNRVTLVTRFIQGRLRVMTDKLSCQKQVLPTEWTLDPLVCQDLWKLWGKPMIDLFVTSRNHRLPLHCSPAPDPLA